VEETIILAPEIFTEIKLGTVAWMEVQPLKDLENAVIHPYVMLSPLQLISWRGRACGHSLPAWDRSSPLNPSTQGVIVYMGPTYEKFIYQLVILCVK